MIPIFTTNIVAQIPADSSPNPFNPHILTDEFISKIRHKLINKNTIDRRPIVSLLSGLNQLAGIMHMQLPMVGQPFMDMCKHLHIEIDSIYDSEFSNLEYLTGNGLVGSYIKDFVDMFTASITVHEIKDGYAFCSDPKPTIAFEHDKIFNYHPIILTNPDDNEEYCKLKELILKINNFLYITQIHKTDFAKDFKKSSSISVDYKYLTSIGNGDITGSGFYTSYSQHNGNQLSLVVTAPFRDTKVAIVIGTEYKYSKQNINVRLFYYHRAEMCWISHKDQHPLLLEGIYEVLYKEASEFFKKLGWEFEQDFNNLANEINEDFKKLSSLMKELESIGSVNQLTDHYPGIECARPGTIDFNGEGTGSYFDITFRNKTTISGAVYDVNEKRHTRININKLIYNGYIDNCDSYGILMDNECGLIPDPNNFITMFLLKEVHVKIKDGLEKLQASLEYTKLLITNVSDSNVDK